MIVPMEDALEAIRAAAVEENLSVEEAAVREPRMLIHTFSHGAGSPLGANWTIGQAFDYVRAADSIVWVEHQLHHDLEVRARDRLIYFDVRRQT